MLTSKEGDLVTASLNYIARCNLEGDETSLRRMQIGRDELEAIGRLTVHDLQQLATMKVNCIKVRLETELFWSLLELLKKRQVDEDQINLLLVNDSPLAMMNHLYGMSSREYTARRKQLDLQGSVGRPSLPNFESKSVLFDHWNALRKKLNELDLKPEHYLELHAKTEVSMRAIWQLTQVWVDYATI